MNKLKCIFGFHKTKTLGYGGFWAFKILQCTYCNSGFQEMDYGPFRKWLTRKKLHPKKFKEYLDTHKDGYEA